MRSVPLLQRQSRTNIAAVILLAAAASGRIGGHLDHLLLSCQPLWVEHAAYGMMANVTFADALATQGYWRALWSALAGAASAPARGPRGVVAAIAVLAAFPPADHGADVLPVSCACWLTTRAGGPPTLIGGSAPPLLFCSLTGLYNERRGMAVPVARLPIDVPVVVGSPGAGALRNRRNGLVVRRRGRIDRARRHWRETRGDLGPLSFADQWS